MIFVIFGGGWGAQLTSKTRYARIRGSPIEAPTVKFRDS